MFLLSGVNYIMADAYNTTQEIPLIPRSVLFGFEDSSAKGALRLSPNGQHLLYSAPVNKVYNIFMCTRQEDGTFNFDKSVQLTHETEQHIGSAKWMHTNNHVLYQQDAHGDENNHIFCIDIESKKIRDLTPFKGVATSGTRTNKRFPTKIFFTMNKENIKLFDPYILDISSPNSLEKLQTNPGNASNWITDDEWNLKGYSNLNATGGQDVYLRKRQDDESTKKFSWDLEDIDTSGFIDFCDNNESVYILDSKDNNTGKLKKINLDTGHEEVIAYDENYELGGIIIHPDTKQVMSYNIVKDRNKPTILDPELKKDYEIMDKVEDGELVISSMDRDMTMWICCFSYDNKLHNYYLYDRTTKKHSFLCKSSTKLDPYTLVPMKPISYTSRDGLTIHGYLSLPVGNKKNLPMILYVHGGPWARDSWGLDGQVQWLCNRGYAVLQVNFRGSQGYGKAFLNAGNKQYGQKMQNDLTDAVQWAIDNQIANPKKVAIYGGSYGGYATLAGVTFTPDLYACAVDLCGRSNLLTITNRQVYGEIYLPLLKKRIGDPEADEEMLRAHSPLFHAHNIKTPLLIGQGANDQRVRQAESESIVAELKRNNCEYEYILFEDEGHGFRKHANRIKFYTAVEKFFAKHLGGQYEV